MAQSLDKRINAALRSAARLADVESVIGDVETEIAATTKRFDAETARSVDPALTTPEAREARNNAADLEHDIRRLNASLGMLQETRDRLISEGKEAERKARYEAAKAKRDALAVHIRTRYPEIAMELLDMARQIAESDAECKAVNPSLDSAEYLARECGYYWRSDGTSSTPVDRIGDIKLPLLGQSGQYLPVWTSTLDGRDKLWARRVQDDQAFAAKPIDGIATPAADQREAA